VQFIPLNFLTDASLCDDLLENLILDIVAKFNMYTPHKCTKLSSMTNF